MTERSTHRRIGRAVAVVVAGTAFGVAGTLAVAANREEENNNRIEACAPSHFDLVRAAEAAKRLQAVHPERFEQSPRPADYHDLRLAAEWARRMEILDPDGRPDRCR